MKLLAIWNGRFALARLSALKMPPRLAYKLLKYAQKFAAELEACDKQREKYVYEVAGAEPPAIVKLEDGTPEFEVFRAKFNEFLQGESELGWSGMTMDEVIDALGSETGNVISEKDLELLEPFFTAPAKLNS